jgi:predicted DNA-binding transcriptional regulator YafY
MREPTTGSDLRQIIVDHARSNGEGDLEQKAVERRFEEDKGRLREVFGCVIEQEGRNNPYTLRAIEKPLIDLSFDSVMAVAFLGANFSAPGVPMGEEVQALIEQIKLAIPVETRGKIERQKHTLEMDLAIQDAPILEDIQRDIDTTLKQGRLLQVLYQGNSDTEPWWYDIEPERAYVKNTHRYLFARCRSAHSPEKKILEGRHINFRMDRIRETRPLPNHFTKIRPRTIELEYLLSAEVARGGVTQHFKGQQAFEQSDGSVKVKVASENLFIDLRKLLHYGAMCKVTGGEEAVAEMKKIVGDLAGLYE